jgi:tRNA U55 pseudouridine synthase TruB
MIHLKRTRIGAFHVDQGLDPGNLTKAGVLESLRPVADALGELPTIRVDADCLDDLRHGRVIGASACDRVLPASECTVVDQSGALLAVGKFDPAGHSLHPHTVLIG